MGDEVDFELLRDGRRRNVSLHVADDYQQKVRGSRIDRRLTGTELQNFRNEGDAALGSGVLVAKVADASAPQRYGLRAGDVIVAANRRDVRDLADLRDWVRLSNRQILLRVYRAGRFGEVAIR